MSDNGSFDIPRRNRNIGPSLCTIQRAITRALLEYEAVTLEASLPGPEAFRNIERALLAEFVEFAELQANPISGGNMPRDPDIDAAVEAATQGPPKEPITTLLSMLPKTTYNEADADKTGGPDRTLAYVKVQRQILKWLGTNAAETLTPQQGRRWTQEISADKKPTAQDALRLCYYMRSKTLDTYADLKHGSISLYVANRGTDERGPKTDRLYWKQNTKTNVIEYTAPSSRHAAHGARRNGLVPQTTVGIDAILGGLTGNGPATRPQRWDAGPAPPPPGWPMPDRVAGGWDDPALDVEGRDGANDDDNDEGGGDGEAQPAAAAAAAGAGLPHSVVVSNLMSDAQAQLEFLLTSDHSDPT
jgi:hypothetical protein